jgi:hypothetical protein
MKLKAKESKISALLRECDGADAEKEKLVADYDA